MQLAKKGLFIRTATKNWLYIPFAKKSAPRTVQLIERDEYDLETAIKLVKANAVSSIDESIDILIK